MTLLCCCAVDGVRLDSNVVKQFEQRLALGPQLSPCEVGPVCHALRGVCTSMRSCVDVLYLCIGLIMAATCS